MLEQEIVKPNSINSKFKNYNQKDVQPTIMKKKPLSNQVYC